MAEGEGFAQCMRSTKAFWNRYDEFHFLKPSTQMDVTLYVFLETDGVTQFYSQISLVLSFR